MWDDGYVDFERNTPNPGSADSEPFSPSVGEPIADAVVVPGQLHDYIFQNSLRDAALSNSTTWPDLPWETPSWKCIFDDAFDLLDAINPEKSLSGPAPPSLRP